MKKISFLLCMIVVSFLFIGCIKAYDDTKELNTLEYDEYYYEDFDNKILKQLVMINDELYYNTKQENTIPMKCGTIDGEIISMMNEDGIPNVNNQSNFGAGYGYQIGPQDGKISVNIDNRWIVFEKLQSD